MTATAIPRTVAPSFRLRSGPAPFVDHISTLLNVEHRYRLVESQTPKDPFLAARFESMEKAWEYAAS